VNTDGESGWWLALLRSITPFTGVLFGAVAGLAYVVGALSTDVFLGLSGPTPLAVGLLLGGLVLSLRGALVGTVVGTLVWLVVRRSEFAGPVNPMGMAGLFWIVVLLSAGAGALNAVP
jgi:hypothetical protein